MQAAIRELTEAHRLAPAAVTFSTNLARAYSTIGLDAEARRFSLIAIERGADPTGRRVKQSFVEASLRAGRYEEAAEQVITLLPPALQTGADADAVRLVYTATRDAARRPAAVAALRATIRKLAPQDWVVKVFAMTWYTQVGAIDDAYDVAEQLREQFKVRNPVNAWSWMWTPELRDFRRDPRFESFTGRVGLMDYWKKYRPPDGCELSSGQLTCR
jgi:hypothetical protein